VLFRLIRHKCSILHDFSWQNGEKHKDEENLNLSNTLFWFCMLAFGSTPYILIREIQLSIHTQKGSFWIKMDFLTL